jgi:hypothetical protein
MEVPRSRDKVWRLCVARIIRIDDQSYQTEKVTAIPPLLLQHEDLLQYRTAS